MRRSPVFVLVHSPLVGPLTWVRVAEELARRGREAVAPPVRAEEGPGRPYWQQHAAAVAAALAALAPDHPLLLVGHSGAGMLLPAIREASARPAAAYLFVDAGIPVDGRSSLDLFGDAAAAAEFRGAARDGLLPPWTDADLGDDLPDAVWRARFVAELRPQPLAAYEEPIPVFPAWPDAPCGYLQFSPAYDAPAAQARRAGWPVIHLPGGHFHMLVDPVAVTDALLALLAAAGVRGAQRG